MDRSEWRSEAARNALSRLLPRLEADHKRSLADIPARWNHFKNRLHREWERLFIYLHELYGWQYDFFYTLERVLDMLIRFWLDRPETMHRLDEQREADPLWFLSEDVVGIVLYVDLFSDNLAGLRNHVPYFEKLGVTYLHLMPLFSVPRGENDGGYAVSDYRAVNPDLGTMEDLSQLASELRGRGISLVLDFVFNHTSDEHAWAQKAKAGDPEFLNYYFTFPDRTLVDRFQEQLRDIFPTVRKGSFTWNDELQRWVWTTFNSYQWDLNYGNPAVFQAIAEEMLFLANQGVEVLRLDAVAFIWKRLGTNCENQPEAHAIIRAFNAMARIVAPSLLFKSEAIVHPDDVISYVHPQECQLSYNPLLMALLWEALATREVRLLEHAMRHRERLPFGCAWVNYLRCHDDIGWTFDDKDAWHLGINPQGHRKFLNDFYTGKHPGSFSRGVPFQFNPDNGDPRKVNDSRWVHRSKKRWEAADDLTNTDTLEWRFFHEMAKLFKQRKQSSALRNGGMALADTGNPHLFAYIRDGGDQRLLIINNFSEYAQVMNAAALAASGMRRDAHDIFTQRAIPAGEDLEIDAYRYLWIDISGQ